MCKVFDPERQQKDLSVWREDSSGLSVVQPSTTTAMLYLMLKPGAGNFIQHSITPEQLKVRLYMQNT